MCFSSISGSFNVPVTLNFSIRSIGDSAKFNTGPSTGPITQVSRSASATTPASLIRPSKSTSPVYCNRTNGDFNSRFRLLTMLSTI